MGLVLRREEGETVRIGPAVEVTVGRIGRKDVELAIEAPAEMEIVRGPRAAEKAVKPNGSEQR